ncbi:UDP-N-acetylenolpyruvoylglucosamine reductase [Mycolicibacterium aromaticivorans JS19b1 = JCM 16368]|uniref:UDP-N-acetylenolpyruvoylglucosamine reductase n=1 Tax=Mycolicibacterium aromaticivorans JS19b1 = JCM 16368 TaxID=1440774 RepID=A0A064CJK7_9MYCO|nr:UDP-N-acetylmuramate dehydrogenase [Mycolicibacterium aromaticivorans]KDF00531.1 UDP-N-acetylenolpyruvoylglucosamine reductase [Mycolicibacterium aromaticivorans JS19b1 = JCM 16368]
MAAGNSYGGAALAENVPLAPLTTLRVGPVARRLITCTTTDQIVSTLRTLDGDCDGPVLVLAGGSNVVIADDLTDVTVVLLANRTISIEGGLLRAEAGAVWDDVVVAAVAAGLGGLECLSGIPGSAGATPVQNVGAYGVEVADYLTRVRLLDRRSSLVRWMPAADLGLGYRHSDLKGSSDAVVLEVEFGLDTDGCSAPLRYAELTGALGVPSGERAAPADVRRAVLSLRARKGMVLDVDDHDTWSVGSFFTNPVVPAGQFEELQGRADGPVPHYPADDGVKLAAGWLVENAGFGRGYPGSDGAPCRLSTKHALALTNRGGATTADVLALARTVRDGVRDSFGITLVPEPVLVGCSL